MAVEGVRGSRRPAGATNAPLAGDRAPSRNLRPLAELWPFVKVHWSDAVASLIALLFSASASLGLTGALRLVIDKGFGRASHAALNETFLVLVAVACVLAFATACRFYFINKLGERVVADLRTALYRRVLALDQTFFIGVSSGEVLSRMTTDMTIVEAVVGSAASIALRNLLTVAGALIMLAFISPSLALCVVLLGPFVLIPLVLYGRRVRRLSLRAQERFGEAIAFAGETLDAVDTVQAFGRERSVGDQFSRSVEAAFGASLARIGARAVMTGGVMILVFGGVAALFWLGANQVLSGRLTEGALTQFALLAVLATGSVGSLSEVWGDVQKAAGAMDRIGALLRTEPAISAPARPTPLPWPATGEVAFRNVVFAYPGRPDFPALNGVDLQVRAGERVALVGPSGAGKSTVFRLLLRFYDPTRGEVLMDGIDLRRADPAEVRARIALVAQEAPLFSGSALENLRFGRKGADKPRILAAIRAAQAENFLQALPQGLETRLGERARRLSGGERQRLVIARALVRDAPILLLDEATSALDAENEQLIQRALDEAMNGRTTLVIAHRLATILKADRIVVLDAGRVVDQGTHAELIARGGLYARLAELQFGMEAA
ncbi:MAG TPA: ABC transporter transmembrane domain-containing protein [Caulobacteraceae bacterium]